MNKFRQTAPQVQLPPPPSYAEKSFLHTVPAAVAVPFWQSVIIACSVGLVTFILQMRFSAILIDAFWNTVTVTVVVFLLSFVFLLRHWFALTIEKVFDIDIPGMGEEKISRTEVWIKRDNGNRASLARFPISDELVTKFFVSTLRGKPISRRQWTPKKSGGMSQNEWEGFWGEMVAQGLGEEVGDTNRLTPDGEVFGRQWIASHAPHSPLYPDVPENHRAYTNQPPTNHPEWAEILEGEEVEE